MRTQNKPKREKNPEQCEGKVSVLHNNFTSSSAKRLIVEGARAKYNTGKKTRYTQKVNSNNSHKQHAYTQYCTELSHNFEHFTFDRKINSRSFRYK